MFSGVFSRNKSSTSFIFLAACLSINRATPIDNIASIYVIFVNFISIEPINTTTHPSTSSNI